MKWFACPEANRLTVSPTELTLVVRRMRHAFLNDLQVLSGWLQLGRPASAVEYLGRVQARLASDSSWTAVSVPDLEAALYLARAHAEGAGLVFLATIAGAPEPDYLLTAAASRERAGADEGLAGSVALGVLALLRGVIDRTSRAADRYATGLEVTVSFLDDRLELAVRVSGAGPSLASELAGVENEALVGCGFLPLDGGVTERSASPLGEPGRAVVGVDWRRFGPDRATSQVAEDGLALSVGVELIVVAKALGTLG